MRHRILFISIALSAFAVTMSAQTPAAAPIPHLEKRGAVTHLIVDGRPWLGLAGELLNNAASTAENVRPVWPDLVKANLNTALVGVGWGWTEPQEGKFDFSALDGALSDARLNGLHVVLLWFGSWKNGTSSYPPAWVKRNPDKYPVARDKDGKGREILSTLSATNMEADGRAYAAMMRHVRETDPGHTVIMIQMENEVGLLGDSRDRSKEANDAFAAAVPKELMDYLQKNKNNLLPETRKLWDAAGGKTSGTWEEVFGKGTGADEAFMAWHYARYMNRITELGKKELPIPVYVNAWLVQPQDKVPGDYPSGGPQAHNHDFWRAGAPAIDILAPDIYLTNFAEIATMYSRNGNPLFIPETRGDAANAFYAIGQLNAQMFSPFGIERQVSADGPLAAAYGVLKELTPLIMEHQTNGTMKAVMMDAGTAAQKVTMGNYVFELAMGGGRGAAPPPAAPAAGGGRSAAGVPQAAGGGGFGGGGGRGGQAAARGYAIVIQTGPDDFWVAGANLGIKFSSTVAATPMASLAAVEEGKFVNGAWVVGRHLAGDDTGMGGGDRASLRLTGNPGILRVSLFSYR
jgi:beta-galactosidase GanA